MGFDIKDQLLLGAIRSEAKARAAAIAALQSQIQGLGTNVAAYSAQISQVASFLDGGFTFNASALVGRIGLTQIEPGYALASDLLYLTAEVEGNNTTNTAAITSLSEVVATETSALAQITTSLTTSVQNNNTSTNANITQTAIVLATATTALASVVSTLTATEISDVATLNASITTEATTRATNDTAIALTVTNLTATVVSDVSTLNGTITTNATTAATATAAVATTVTTLTATVASNLTTVNASISSEATTRSTNDSAIVTTLTTVNASISSEATVFSQSTTPTANLTGDIWYNTSTTAVEYWNGSAWGSSFVAPISVTSAISTAVTTTEAFATSAVATAQTTLTASINTKNSTFFQTGTPTATAVGDMWVNTSTGLLQYWNGTVWGTSPIATAAIAAAVTTESSARATADGNLSANYSLTITAGNIITGMQLNSSSGGGTTSSVIAFEASVFKVSDGTSNYPVFTITGGVVTIGTELDVGTSMNETKITASGFNFGGGYINMAGSGSYGTLTVGVSGNTISLQALSGTAAISFNVSSTSVGNISNSGVATLVSGSTTEIGRA